MTVTNKLVDFKANQVLDYLWNEANRQSLTATKITEQEHWDAVAEWIGSIFPESIPDGQLEIAQNADGCCSNCTGNGVDIREVESNGRCWDCYDTGHAHESGDACELDKLVELADSQSLDHTQSDVFVPGVSQYRGR